MKRWITVNSYYLFPFSVTDLICSLESAPVSLSPYSLGVDLLTSLWMWPRCEEIRALPSDCNGWLRDKYEQVSAGKVNSRTLAILGKILTSYH
jgi:hypothetical protein